MDEEPEGVVGVVAGEEEVAYHEVDALGVAHFGEVVGNSFEDGFE